MQYNTFLFEVLFQGEKVILMMNKKFLRTLMLAIITLAILNSSVCAAGEGVEESNPALAGDNNRPLIRMGFSEKQIEDILDAHYSGLEIQILTRNKNGKLEIITLIGESHDQEMDLADKGTHLLEHYSVIGVEPNMDKRAEGIFIAEGFLRNVMKISHILRLNPYAHSLTGYQHSEKTIFNLEKGVPDLLGIKESRNAVILLGMQIAFRQYSATLSSVFMAALLMETARAWYKINYYSTDVSNIVMRDQVIANSILETFAHSLETQMAAVMGMGHLYGVRKFLIKRGFTDQSAAIGMENSLSAAPRTDTFDTLGEDAGEESPTFRQNNLSLDALDYYPDADLPIQTPLQQFSKKES